MGNKFLKFIRKTGKAVTKDKARTLTCINAAGVVVTAGVSFKAGMNVQKKIDNGTLTKPDILKEIAPVVASVVITEVAGISSYKASAKTIADLTMGLTSAKKEYEALERKMKEELGEEKAEEIKKEAAKEVADEKLQQGVMPDITGYFWFKDEFTGAYFYTRESDILKAWNKVSKKLYIGDRVSINDFYYEIDRKDQMYESHSLTKQFGWDGENPMANKCYLNLNGTSEMPNGAPCRCFRYSDSPEALRISR